MNPSTNCNTKKRQTDSRQKRCKSEHYVFVCNAFEATLNTTPETPKYWRKFCISFWVLFCFNQTENDSNRFWTWKRVDWKNIFRNSSELKSSKWKFDFKISILKTAACILNMKSRWAIGRIHSYRHTHIHRIPRTSHTVPLLALFC